jgi:hypothetical protein
MIDHAGGRNWTSWRRLEFGRRESPAISARQIVGPHGGPGNQDVLFNTKLCAAAPLGVAEAVLEQLQPATPLASSREKRGAPGGHPHVPLLRPPKLQDDLHERLNEARATTGSTTAQDTIDKYEQKKLNTEWRKQHK